MTVLLVVGAIVAGLAALVHVFIFVLESVLWPRESTWRRFGLRSQADADVVRPMALNQGFYNLFLAIGTIVGLLLLGVSRPAGLALIFLAVGSMLAASLVLVISNPKLARAAVTQGALPLIAIVLLAIGATAR